MYIQAPLPRELFPALSKEAIGDGNSLIGYAKAVSRAQSDCAHDGETRRFNAYSHLEQCMICGYTLPAPPLPRVDLHDADSDLAWAVAFVERPPSQPGVIGLVALSHAVRHGNAAWSLQVFDAERTALRALGYTPASYLESIAL